MKEIKNKKAISISIVVLVLMTLVIVGASLYVFVTHSDKIGTQVRDARMLDDFYLRENEINFYVYDIMEKSAAKTKNGNPADFIKNFKNELNYYKNNNSVYLFDFFDSIEAQATENNFRIDNGKIFMYFRIKLTKDYEKLVVSHLYEKEFSVDLK